MKGYGFTRLWLAATAEPMQSISPEEASMEQLAEAMQSSASSGEKTSFLIEYLLAQRGVVLDAVKTIFFALVVYLIGKRVVKLALRMTNRWMVKREVEAGVQNFVMSFARVLYHLVLILIVAWILGVGATIIAIVGSAGLAIGLALQGSLANLAGGVLILALKPFRVGEYIAVSGVEGTVEGIDIFYTRIATSDNKKVMIPNGTITSNTITNTTHVTKRMLILDFMVPYETDIKELREQLLQMLGEEPLVLQEEPKNVVINKLSPLKVQMQLKAWVWTEHYWDARYQILEQLKDILDEKRIE